MLTRNGVFNCMPNSGTSDINVFEFLEDGFIRDIMANSGNPYRLSAVSRDLHRAVVERRPPQAIRIESGKQITKDTTGKQLESRLQSLAQTFTITSVHMLEHPDADKKSTPHQWRDRVRVVLEQCPQLERLSLTGCSLLNWGDSANTIPQLHLAHIEAPFTSLDFTICKELKHLSLYDCGLVLRDWDLLDLITHPKLDSLDLRRNLLELMTTVTSHDIMAQIEETARESELRTLDLRDMNIGATRAQIAEVYGKTPDPISEVALDINIGGVRGQVFAEGVSLEPFVARGLHVLEGSDSY